MRVWSLLLVIGALVLIFMLFTPRREGFNIHLRDGVICYPFLNHREDWLLPDSQVFVIQGYNYQETPKIYRDGSIITPLQYARDYSNMVYYFAVYAPNGLCDSQWVIETSDNVKPTVNDGRLGTRLEVNSTQESGYYRWAVSC